MSANKQYIFLCEMHEAEALHSSCQRYLEQSTVVSLNLDVSAFLKEKRLLYLELSHFLSLADIREIRSEAERLCDTWFQSFEVDLHFRNINLPHADRFAMTYFFRDALLAMKLFQRVLAETPAEKLKCFFPSDDARPSVGYVWSDTPYAVWKYMCESNGIPYDILSIPGRETEHAHFRSHLFGYFRNALSFLTWKLNPRHKRPRIIFLIGFSEARRYEELAHNLRKRFSKNISLFRTALSLISPTTSTQYNVTFQSLPSLFPMRKYFSVRRKHKTLWHKWRTSLSSKIEPKEIFHNPHLDFHFKHYFLYRWPLLSEYIDHFERMIKALRPQVLLTTNLTSVDPKLALVAIADRYNVRSVTIPHTATPIVDGNVYFTQSAFAWTTDFLWSDRSADRKTDLHIVGFPRYFTTHLYPTTEQTPSRSGDTLTVLVLTSTAQQNTLPNVDMGKYVSTLQTLMDPPQALQKRVRILLKTHPIGIQCFDQGLLYKRLAEQSNVRIQIYSNANLRDLVNVSDLVIVPTIPSSAYLEPLFQRKPIIYLDTADYDCSDFWFAKMSKSARITDLSMFWTQIEKFMNDPELRKQILSENQRFLDSILPNQKNAYDILAEHLATLMQD